MGLLGYTSPMGRNGSHSGGNSPTDDCLDILGLAEPIETPQRIDRQDAARPNPVSKEPAHRWSLSDGSVIAFSPYHSDEPRYLGAARDLSYLIR